MNDLDQYSLRSSKWEARTEEEGSHLLFIGAVDQVVNLQDRCDFSHINEISGEHQEATSDGSTAVDVRSIKQMGVHNAEGYVAPDEAF